MKPFIFKRIASLAQAIEAGEVFRVHAFEYACAQNDIDHRLNGMISDRLLESMQSEIAR